MSEKKRILIATGIFPPQVGGPATYSKLLLEQLPVRGFDVKVVNFGDYLVYPKIIRHIVYFFKILLSARWADIVYAQDPVSVGLPAMLASRFAGKKFFLKIVGDYAWEQGSQRSGVTDLLDVFASESEKYPFFVRVLKKIQLHVAQEAQTIVVPSQYLKKIVSAWGVESGKISVIYNAFNAPQVSSTKQELHNMLLSSHPTIVSAGRLVPWKGFDTIISVLPLIAKTIPEIRFVILGDGPDRLKLETCAKDHGVENRVMFMGNVPQDELFRYIKAAEAFVLNTSYEGFSHQILEVLALETPILTTRAGGNVEIIESGKNGLLIDYNDREALCAGVIALLTDPVHAHELAQAGSRTIQNYSEARMLEEISKILNS